MTSADLLSLCERLGVPARNHSVTINEAYADMVRRRATRDGLVRGQQSLEDVQPVGIPTADSLDVSHDPNHARRSLSILHLQTIWRSVAGREALTSRELLTHMNSEGHRTTVRTVIGDSSGVLEEFRGDFLSILDFRSAPPDVLISEHSLLGPDPAQMRVPAEELRRFLTSGGIVVVDNCFPDDGFDREEDWRVLSSFLSLNPLDGKSLSTRGSRLRTYNTPGPGHPQVVTCTAADSGAAPWLRPAYENVEALQILNVRPVWATEDPIGRISEFAADLLSSDDTLDIQRGPYAWGVAKQIGSGYLVAITGSLMHDFVVSQNPDNALFIQKLIELLVGEVERERGIRGEAEASRTWSAEEAHILDLISKGENSRVEFKSSARHDLQKDEKNPAIEDEIAKQVVGFWNSEGGDLLIGVSDDGEVVGIEHDYAHCGKSANSDGWIRFIEELLLDRVPEITPPSVRVVSVADREIGWVEVPRGHREAFFLARRNASGSRDERFFLRLNNSTRELKGGRLADYLRDRFSDR